MQASTLHISYVLGGLNSVIQVLSYSTLLNFFSLLIILFFQYALKKLASTLTLLISLIAIMLIGQLHTPGMASFLPS